MQLKIISKLYKDPKNRKKAKGPMAWSLKEIKEGYSWKLEW